MIKLCIYIESLNVIRYFAQFCNCTNMASTCHIMPMATQYIHTI